jgi:hypothetical protein
MKSSALVAKNKIPRINNLTAFLTDNEQNFYTKKQNGHVNNNAGCNNNIGHSILRIPSK